MKDLEQIAVELDKINFNDNQIVVLDGSAEIILIPHKPELSKILNSDICYEIWVKKDEKDFAQKTTKIGDYIIPGSYEFIGHKIKQK